MLSGCEDSRAPMDAVETLSIVVPTFNERENLSRLVEAIDREAPIAYEVIVVDDASPDGTGDLARELSRLYPVRLRERSGRRGLGSAYRDGFGLAQGDAIVQMDADLSHDPGALPELVQAVQQGAGVAVGSRYRPGGSSEGWPLHRRAISRTANVLAGGVVGLGVKDATSGYRCIARGCTDVVRETSADGFAFQIEVLSNARDRGIDVKEVPICFRGRRQGDSKLQAREILTFALTLTRLGVARRG